MRMMGSHKSSPASRKRSLVKLGKLCGKLRGASVHVGTPWLTWRVLFGKLGQYGTSLVCLVGRAFWEI